MALSGGNSFPAATRWSRRRSTTPSIGWSGWVARKSAGGQQGKRGTQIGCSGSDCSGAQAGPAAPRPLVRCQLAHHVHCAPPLQTRSCQPTCIVRSPASCTHKQRVLPATPTPSEALPTSTLARSQTRSLTRIMHRPGAPPAAHQLHPPAAVPAGLLQPAAHRPQHLLHIFGRCGAGVGARQIFGR